MTNVAETVTSKKASRKGVATPAPLAEPVKVIETFAGFEKEYEKFTQSVEANDKKDVQFIKNILNVFVSDELRDQVIKSVKIASRITALTYEKNNIEKKLVNCGSKAIDFWNAKYPVPSMLTKSIRYVVADNVDNSVMVTMRSSYPIKSDLVLELKKELGETYDKIFAEEEICVLKNDQKDVLFKLLEKIMGKAAQIKEFFFDTKVSVTLKSSTELEKFYASKDISDDLKNRMRMACTKQKTPSISYPTVSVSK